MNKEFIYVVLRYFIYFGIYNKVSIESAWYSSKSSWLFMKRACFPVVYTRQVSKIMLHKDIHKFCQAHETDSEKERRRTTKWH